MAGWLETTVYCRQHNRRERGVHEVAAFHMSGYWPYSYGNFYIGGGDEKRRRAIMLSKLVFAGWHDQVPTIILTKSGDLARELIAINQQHHIFPSLTVSGIGRGKETGANYQFLYGMNPADISSFLIRMMSEQGGNNMETAAGFVNALTQIGHAVFPDQLSLQVIDWLLSLTNNEILELAHSHGVAANVIDHYRATTEAHKGLMGLVSILYSITEHLTSKTCDTHLNLVGRIREDQGKGGVTVIENTSKNQTLMNAMLAAELSQLARETYRLILYEADVQQDDDIHKMVLSMVERNAQEIGVCYENPSLFLGERSIAGFNNHIFLGRNSISEKNQREILSFEGEYNRLTPRLEDHGPHHKTLFPQYRAFPDTELRVSPKDMMRFDAMLKDGNNRLRLVRKLGY